MQEKLSKPASVVSPKVSFSPQGPEQIKPLQSNIKKTLSIALVTLTLLGGAGFFITKGFDHQADETAQSVKQHKAEFVKNALALSDDGYQSVDPYKHGDHQINGSLDDHDHNAEATSESTSVPAEATSIVDRQISTLPDVNLPGVEEAVDPSSVSPSEDDERLRAIESEALSLNISEGVESHHDAERSELMLRKAEELAKYKLAREEAFKKREALRAKGIADKARKDVQLRIQASRMAMKVPYLLSQNPKYEAFRGALTKCHIKGHDIHWINDQGWILEHLKVDAVLTLNVLAARHIIAEKGGGVVVVVYEKGFEAYDSEGNLIQTGNKE